MTLDRIDRDAFQLWLKAEPSYANVGYARQNCYCPIAMYLKKLTGRRHLVIPTGTPTWIVAFMTAVDQQNSYGDSITARDALNYLANIP